MGRLTTTVPERRATAERAEANERAESARYFTLSLAYQALQNLRSPEGDRAAAVREMREIKARLVEGTYPLVVG